MGVGESPLQREYHCLPIKQGHAPIYISLPQLLNLQILGPLMYQFHRLSSSLLPQPSQRMTEFKTW